MGVCNFLLEEVGATPAPAPAYQAVFLGQVQSFSSVTFNACNHKFKFLLDRIFKLKIEFDVICFLYTVCPNSHCSLAQNTPK